MNKKLPYTPHGIEIKYVKEDNFFMQHAKKVAMYRSLDAKRQTGAVIVDPERFFDRGTAVIAIGANGSLHHFSDGCERVAKGCKTGEGYDLCEGCHPRNHAEQTAILNARDMMKDTNGAILYLWGHWWCCKSCCDAMIGAGITKVYLSNEARE